MREEMKFSDEGPAQEQKQICMSQATFMSLKTFATFRAAGWDFWSSEHLARRALAELAD